MNATNFLRILLLVLILSSTVAMASDIPMFHIRGTIAIPWSFRPPMPVLHVQITFERKNSKTIIVARDDGSYEAALPVGFYKMTAQAEKIGRSLALTTYVQFFRITHPVAVVVNGSLYEAPVSCDTLVPGDSPEQRLEAFKDVCGGDDLFHVTSKQDVPFQMWVRYSKRDRRGSVYTYQGDRTKSDPPVLLTYNLFSLRADNVSYDTKNHQISARGHVVIEDERAKVQQLNSIVLKIGNGRVILASRIP